MPFHLWREYWTLRLTWSEKGKKTAQTDSNTKLSSAQPLTRCEPKNGDLNVTGIFNVLETAVWAQLETPFGNVVRLVAGDIDHVVVETDRGTTYEVQCHKN
jgi:hypothetical protein